MHVAKSLTSFKLCATTPNIMQQGVQTDAMYTIQQCRELLAKNVASVCTGLKRHYCKVQCKRTQHCWLTCCVTCCVRLLTLLHVVACCWELLRKAGLKRVKHLATRKRTQRARSIQPKFPEILDQNIFGLNEILTRYFKKKGGNQGKIMLLTRLPP